jgi:mono/diheme cytochrome c family protein
VAGSRLLVAASVWLLSAGWAVISAAPAQDVPAPAASPAAANHRAVLDKYCVTCHNQRIQASDLALDVVDVGRPSTNGQVWEDVIRKLRARSMPPQGMPRPDEASYTALTTWLESELDRAGAAAPNPGRPLIRRLNRSEYANAVRDLVGPRRRCVVDAPDPMTRRLDSTTSRTCSARRRRCSNATSSPPIG